jgi:hypothetical protein
LSIVGPSNVTSVERANYRQPSHGRVTPVTFHHRRAVWPPSCPGAMPSASVTAESIPTPKDGAGAISLEFLRTMAESTGGHAVVNNNEPERQVAAVLAESSSYYLLGVEPPAPRSPRQDRRALTRALQKIVAWRHVNRRLATSGMAVTTRLAREAHDLLRSRLDADRIWLVSAASAAHSIDQAPQLESRPPPEPGRWRNRHRRKRPTPSRLG